MSKRLKIGVAAGSVLLLALTAVMARGLYLYYHKNDEANAAFDHAIGDCVSDRTRAVNSDSQRDAASSDCMHESLDEEK